MKRIEDEITALLTKVYKDSLYPKQCYFIIDENLADELAEKISEKCNVNAKDVKCPDCHYCFQIAISSCKEIPIVPGSTKQRKEWIKKYRGHNQMYLALSKLGKYAMVYWTEYRTPLFINREQYMFTPPNDKWIKIGNCIKDIMEQMNIKTINPSLIFRQYKINYEGEIEGYDAKPTLQKLLFTEELH